MIIFQNIVVQNLKEDLDVCKRGLKKSASLYEVKNLRMLLKKRISFRKVFEDREQ